MGHTLRGLSMFIHFNNNFDDKTILFGEKEIQKNINIG